MEHQLSNILEEVGRAIRIAERREHSLTLDLLLRIHDELAKHRARICLEQRQERSRVATSGDRFRAAS